MTAVDSGRKQRVVVVGAGFGGIFTAQNLNDPSVEVLLIDRSNFHTFTPLLYQVATSGLEPAEIAYPVRGIFRKQKNVTFLMGEVTSVDTQDKVVRVQANGEERVEPYDYLVMAAGSVSNFFNNPALSEHAFELKTVEDAVRMRNHVLKLFERAVWTQSTSAREELMTIVVVGGGPTGLETAGAMHELFLHVLHKEHPGLPNPRVILIEAMGSILTAFPENLRQSALEQLQSMGVEVMLNSAVADIQADKLILRDGTEIRTRTVVWSAGIKASPLATMLGVPLQRGGRVPIQPTIEAVGLDDVYVVGDMAYLERAEGQPYPQLIPVAKQMGILAARNILRRVHGQAQNEFRYNDRGTMATIGRSRAVAWLFNRVPLTGYLAWAAWLALHLFALMGFRNRLSVFVNWVWNYFTYDRSMRVIMENITAKENKASTPRDPAAVSSLAAQPIPVLVESMPQAVQSNHVTMHGNGQTAAR